MYASIDHANDHSWLGNYVKMLLPFLNESDQDLTICFPRITNIFKFIL